MGSTKRVEWMRKLHICMPAMEHLGRGTGGLVHDIEFKRMIVHLVVFEETSRYIPCRDVGVVMNSTPF